MFQSDLSLSLYSLPRWVVAFAEREVWCMVQMEMTMTVLVVILQTIQNLRVPKLRARISSSPGQPGVHIGPSDSFGSYQYSKLKNIYRGAAIGVILGFLWTRPLGKSFSW